jgi:transmembrane sensor
MSYSEEDLDVAAPSSDIDMCAAEFVERRDSRHWTDEDEAALEVWLTESSTHRVAFLRLNSSWRRTERLIALRSPEQEQPSQSSSKTPLWRLRNAAVLGLLLVFGGAIAGYLLVPRYVAYATTVGGHKTLALRDGSQIELNTNTLIRVSQNTADRLIRLDRGEVYFQVRHDVARPFVVIAAGRRLVDLGTKFSVRADADELKVALVEGRVRVEATDRSGRSQRAVLSPGDVLLASHDSLSVTKKTPGELTNALAWRRGMLVFHGTTLADAAIEFNRYNETKIVIADSVASREAINGTLPSDDLQEFARMARNIFGLRTERRGNVIVFAR